MATSTMIAAFTPAAKLAYAQRIVDRALASRLHSYTPQPSIMELRQAIEALAEVEAHLREKGGAA